MKRIIDGVTYNTVTSTKLARSEYEAEYNHVDRPCVGTLYQTRGGAFFVHECIELGMIDPSTDEYIYRDRFEAYSAESAQTWLMNGEVEVFHNPFDEPPEAEAEVETSATIYARVPLSLKQRIDAAAKSDGLSGNAWTMRCAERCLARPIESRKEALRKYLEEELPTNGHGEITAERLRKVIANVVEMTAAW